MPELAKAKLQQLNADFQPVDRGNDMTVQFNPETLKVSYANQIQTQSGTGDQNGTPPRQFVGAGTTKLSLQLWFDVTAEMADSQREADVRKLTQKVAFFITPDPDNNNVPPGVRFLWGSFSFDGLMESLEESLEFFSADGIPLRASMTLNLTQQKIVKFTFAKNAAATPPGTGKPKVPRALAAAPAGSTLQGMAAQQGKADLWQAIAAANNIENPRMLQPGQLIDLEAKSPLPF